MLIFDAHLDLAWNAIDWNRDLELPVAAIRKREQEQAMTGKGRGVGTVSFHELRRGRIGVFIATLLPRLLRQGLMPAVQRYESMEAAYAAAHGQLAYYRILEQRGLLRRPIVPAHCKHNGHLYYVLLPSGIDRGMVLGKLREAEIHAVFHYVPLHSAPAGLTSPRPHITRLVLSSLP